MGTFYDRIAGIKAVFDRFNSGTAYGHNADGNNYKVDGHTNLRPYLAHWLSRQLSSFHLLVREL